jgi:DMSO/TMAO reductase YedYZ molybdopterin-dependent catalytic subunit
VSASITRIRRRELLKLSPLTLLAGVTLPSLRTSALQHGQALTDAVLAKLPSGLAPTFAQRDLTPLANFPVNAYLTEDPDVDTKDWRLSLEGAVEHPGRYSIADLHALPKHEQITRHVCIEGWAVIGSFGGVRLSELLQRAGLDPTAQFVEVECADDYYESIDIACALHPQTLLCYEMYGHPLTPGHGAPVRLQMPTKLGYKQAKHVVSLRVSKVLGRKRGYWVDQGYPWFGGI